MCVAGGCEILGAAYDEMKMCVGAFRENQRYGVFL